MRTFRAAALALVTAFSLAACSPDSAEEPAEQTAEEPSALEEDLAEGGQEREASVAMLTAWFLDLERAPAAEAQDLSTQWGRDLVYDNPDAPVTWTPQHRDLQGQTSEEVPAPWPGFDATLRRFTDEDSGLDFLAVGLRLDYDDVADFTDGMATALDNSENPQVPGVVGTAEDHEHYYLSAVLDLNFVEMRTDAAVESFTEDLFLPVDYWRDSLQG